MITGIEFVEILRVTSDKEKVNDSVKPETILIDDIKSFRQWHKGRNDSRIKGDMTIIIVKDDKEKKDNELEKIDPIYLTEEEKQSLKPKVKTILIEENYNDFLNRMSAHVPIRKLDDYYVLENGKYTNAKVIRRSTDQ